MKFGLKGGIVLMIMAVVLSSCTSFMDIREVPKDVEPLGEVETKTIIPRVFFTSFRDWNRKRIAKSLVKAATKKYGKYIDIYIIDTESKWNPLSLALYFDSLGFVETVDTKAIVVKSDSKISVEKIIANLYWENETLPVLGSLPDFPDAENAFVFELKDDPEDFIIFKNHSHKQNFTVVLYAFIGNNHWEQVASGFLKESDDRDTANTFSGRFKRARYYAIVPSEGLYLTCYASVENDDMVIYLRDGIK